MFIPCLCGSSAEPILFGEAEVGYVAKKLTYGGYRYYQQDSKTNPQRIYGFELVGDQLDSTWQISSLHGDP